MSRESLFSLSRNIMYGTLPTALAPYISSSLNAGGRILITSVLNAPSHWLVLRFIYAALHGVDENNRSKPGENVDHVHTRHQIILASLLKPLALWAESGKKVVRNFHPFVASMNINAVDMCPGS